jgi:hypothetical protein
MIYDFNEQLQKGEHYENELDIFFSKFYKIKKVTMDEQRQGFDRIFIRPDKTELKIEYKSDDKARTTGNFFIELYSVFPTKQGWAYTSQSDYIIYLLVDWRIYVIDTPDMRRWVEKWKCEERMRTCRNKDYESQGILLPLKRIEVVTKKIYEKDGDQWKLITQ